MSNSTRSQIFRFKEFEVDQSSCPMKINTDGVLLGALVRAATPAQILDIGTGTGVVAMMLAQRFPAAYIHAIEINKAAAKTASRNFDNSIFSSRLTCLPVALHDYRPVVLYDLIVSNPPFFLDSLKNPDSGKQIARHTETAFFTDLLVKSSSWLSPEGSLQLVLPTILADAVAEEAWRDFSLYLRDVVLVKSFEGEKIIRKIITLSPKPIGQFTKTEFVIYEDRGIYSAEYRNLLAPFFIGF